MNDEKIGNFIKKLRCEKDLNQTELAKEFNVSPTTINKWEHGKISLTSANLKMLADYFHVSADEMLAGDYINDSEKNSISEVTYELLDQNIHLKKKSKFISKSLTFVLLLFFVYYFINSYGKTKVYTITTDSDNFQIKDSFIFKTPDKIYLTLKYSSKNTINNIKLYTNDATIINTNNINNVITISDSYEEMEYFYFNDFNNLINNLYVEIKMENETLNYKLNIKRDYTNFNLIFSKNKKKSKYIEENKTEIEDYLKYYNNLENKNMKIDLKGIHYNVTLVEDMITVSYEKSELLYYVKQKNISKYYNGKLEYDYLISSSNCSFGNCETADDDLLLIDKLLKSDY